MLNKLLNKTAKFLLFPISLLVIFLGLSFFSSRVEAEGEIEIYTLEDLDNIRNDLTASYILMNDLDFNNDSHYENVDNKATWTTGEGWVPIGNYSTPFLGIFNGQEYTISNLYINKSSGSDPIGLFSSIETSNITNLLLNSIDITGVDMDIVGGLVGYSSNSEITNCNTNGSITASNQIGGLVGRNEETFIYNCHIIVDITGDDHLGGLIGYNQDASVEDSSASGAILSNDYGSNIGGLIGSNSLLMTSERTTITNCNTSGSVTGTYSVGGLVGDNSESDIISCYSDSIVNGEDYSQSVGGLIGDSNEGDIHNSYAIGNVITNSGSYGVGGLVGDDWGNVYNSFATGDVIGDDGVGGLLGGGDGIVNNSYATGNVSEVSGGYEDGYSIGGLIGYHFSGEINKSYSLGSVTAFTEDDIGGLIGLKESEVTVSDSFWDTETSGISTSDGGIGKTSIEMKTLSTFNTWDIVSISEFDPEGSDTWYINEGNDYPRLFIEYEEPVITEIYYLQDLYDIRNDLTGSYILMNNLDFNADSSYDQTDPDWETKKTSWTTSNGWVPIGTDTDLFSGTFDGQENTISNLFMDRTNTPDIWVFGLFGSNEGTISNIGVENVDITGYGYGQVLMGGLVGYNLYGTINNSYATGSITEGTEFGTITSGGLVGTNKAGTISNSYFSGSVTGNTTSSYTGGLVGKNTYDSYDPIIESTITDSYSTGSVSGKNYIGGLIGSNEDSTVADSYSTSTVNGLGSASRTGGLVGSNTGTIEGCYTDGVINHTFLGVSYNSSYSTGGLAGYNDDTIIDSYSKTDVNGTISDTNSNTSWDIGGLVGSDYGTITNSYATGNVTGYWDVGGLVGYSGSNISNSYATGNVTGHNTVGGFLGYDGSSTVTNSYAIGFVTGDDTVGGFVGYEDSGTINNSYWDTENSGQETSPVGIGKTTLEMKTLSTFSTWDIVSMSEFDPEGSDTWYIDEGNDYPRLFLQFSPQIEEEIDPTINTNSAIGITIDSAQIRGEIIDLGTYESIDAYFQYRETGDTWINTTKVTRTTTGPFSKILTNLNFNTDYEFRAIVEFGESAIGYGSTEYFKTSKVNLPKVIITDIGLIDNVPNLDDMLYYFTSQTPKIKGTAYPNSNVKFETENEEFSTQVDSNGNFEISLDLERGTTDLTYFSYSSFGNQSLTRSLTLVIGIENFPPEDEDITPPDEEEQEEQNKEQEDNQQENTEDDSEVAGENITLTFKDKDGNPLDGATIEIDGQTYTTNNKGEIEIAGLQEGIYTAKINYKGKEYTTEILSSKDAVHNITIEIDLAPEKTPWIKIAIYSGLGLIVVLLLVLVFKSKNKKFTE
jgi:hypothetical protein